MKTILELALMNHSAVNIDSSLVSTREFWRRKAGLPEAVVTDPRPLVEALQAHQETSQ